MESREPGWGGMYRPWYTCVSIGQESKSNLDHRGDNLVCLTTVTFDRSFNSPALETLLLYIQRVECFKEILRLSNYKRYGDNRVGQVFAFHWVISSTIGNESMKTVSQYAFEMGHTA